jgi:mannose-1-phosphate guanylyltransferase
MLNGDVLTDVDVTAQLAQHEATGARGTLGLVPVEDPSAYGLVLMRDGGEVTGFLEKPGPDQTEGVLEFLISAGIYVLERSVVDLIEPDRNVSIEREIWPALVGEGLFGFADRSAYWLDIGTPQRYLQGTAAILEGHVQTSVASRLDAARQSVAPGALAEGVQVTGPAIVEGGARLEEGARLIGPAVVGANVRIGARAVVERSVVLDGAEIGAGAHVRDAILAPACVIGPRSVVEGETVLGEGVRVGADNHLGRGIKVFPGTALPDGAISF